MKKRFELQLTDMAHGGEALGRREGKVIFVPYALPGEEVIVEVVEEKKRYARARLVEVTSPSRQRVPPPCPHFGLCGGCHWQHIAYEAQLEFKERVLRDQLARLGGIPGAPLRPVIGMNKPWHYRNHLQFTVNEDGELGFLVADSHQVMPIETCYLPHPLLEEMLVALDLEMPGLKRLSLRAGVNTGQRMVIFETHDDEPFDLQVDLPLSCVFLLRDGRTATLVGYGHITERLAGREYRVSAGSFFQVNTAQAEELVHQVAHYLAPQGDETLLDTYCGVGTFGLSLAERVSHIIGVEENASALADAQVNAAGLENVELIEGRVEEILPRLERRIDMAVLDPPRQGCSPEALAALAELAPAKIVYVSCDPATLARDVRTLCKVGYRLMEVQPIDMFPQTYHIESVALLHKTS